MKIYVNGDSHSAGAEIFNDYCFAEDDPQYKHLGRNPHPDNLDKSYGKKLTNMLEQELVCEAESASSNARIIRTTKDYLKHNKKVFVIIGWSTWEREEWHINGTHYQITASGTDVLPTVFNDNYKTWVAEQTPKNYQNKMNEWNKKIHDFHLELNEQGVNHFFFNTFSHLTVVNRFDFGNKYFYPYDSPYCMNTYLLNSGYVPNKNHHYGQSAHHEWANILFDNVRYML